MTVPTFTISKPTTSGDNGDPSSSCYRDTKRVLAFIEDERHLVANTLYQSVLERLQKPIPDDPTSATTRRRRKSTPVVSEQQQDREDAKELVECKREVLDKLERRCRLFVKAKQNLIDDNQWTLAQTMFGITTYYRREVDGSLSIKMEGTLEGCPLFDQVAVLREVDLHYKWAPFVSSSLTIAHLNKLDTVGWFIVGLPSFGLMRDGCFRAVGCDSMLEDGSILLVGQGVKDKVEDGVKRSALVQEGDSLQTTQEDAEYHYLSKDPILDELDIPPPPTRMGGGRMTIRTFQALIDVESPTQARTRVIANVDPNLPLIPQSLLDFLMKKLCGVLLYKLQHAAKRVSNDPIRNPHASRMRLEEEFYKDWLLEKFRAVCALRNWQMPPVQCFDLSDQQQELALAADARRNKHSQAKTLRFYHSLDDDNLDEFLETNSGNGSEPRNLGQKRPAVRTLSSNVDSVVSDISRDSYFTMFSLWTNNPMANYLRHLEAKTELRKKREIHEARERAANRLKPKKLDETSLSRLEVLKEARKMRLQKNATTNEIKERGIIQSPSNNKPQSDWATMWSNHNKTTRATVILLLMVVLFVLLFMDKLLDSYMSKTYNDRWGGPWQSAFFLVYMSVAGVVHFLLCYIALMYAFSGLQIGSMTGVQAQRFYSRNVHLGVAIVSGGSVTVGIVKALLVTTFRWTLWKLWIVWHFMASVLNDVSLTPPSISNASGHVVGGIRSLLSSIHVVFLQSNIIGRIVSALVLTLGKPFLLLWAHSTSFIQTSINLYQYDKQRIPWASDAYHTTRVLLLYSGFFLLSVLLIFNLFAEQVRADKEKAPTVPVDTDIAEEDIAVEVHSRHLISDDIPPTPENAAVFNEITQQPEMTMSAPPTFDGFSGIKSKSLAASLPAHLESIKEGDTPKKRSGFRLLRSHNRNKPKSKK